MDEKYLRMMSSGRDQAWSETMVNLEAGKLINAANTVASFHLRDGLTRMKFLEEIKAVVEQQFAIARRAKTDEECMACVQNLRAETDNLHEQSRMLRMKAAQLYAKVEFIRENKKIVGYVISAVNVALSGLVFVGGFMMLSTMGPIGMLAGAVLMTDGVNGLSKEVVNFAEPNRQAPYQGFAAESAMQTAQFMGFSPNAGLAFYKGATLGASVYSITGLIKKAGAWRLFKWMPQDFYRKVDMFGRPKLTMKIVGYGIKAKVVFDLLTTDSRNN